MSGFTPPGPDEVLRVDTQTVRDPSDVVEVGNHLGGVVNGYVVEAEGA